jgi:hypothetical protein
MRLGLVILAGLTPPEWEITVIDGNLSAPDYSVMPRPDLEVTAFTSRANRAYEAAAEFRRRVLSVVIGGMHATTSRQKGMRQVDSVVTGKAEIGLFFALADG